MNNVFNMADLAEIPVLGSIINIEAESNGDGGYLLTPHLPEDLKKRLEAENFSYCWSVVEGDSEKHFCGTRLANYEPDSDQAATVRLRLLPPADFSVQELAPFQRLLGGKVKVEQARRIAARDLVLYAEKSLAPIKPIEEASPKLVKLAPSRPEHTADLGLWSLIKINSEKLSWANYKKSIDLVMRGTGNPFGAELDELDAKRAGPFMDTDSYRALKLATEAFLLVNAPTVDTFKWAAHKPRLRQELKIASGTSRTGELTEDFKKYTANTSSLIPYLHKVAENLKGTGFGAAATSELQRLPSIDIDEVMDEWEEIQGRKISSPLFIELIWSYWHEEMQLVQSMHAISRRFQNVHSGGARDPLAQLEVDFLRPLSNLVWGYVQDEQHRLTLARRAFEYSHHYGLALIGKAVPKLRPADNRSKFIEAFHNLLSLCTQFFRQADDTTVVADGFPVLNALREVHILLSEGAGNQFRDLPATARGEMMMEQWILAQPAFREFLPRRSTVAYPEEWMHSVDSMRRLQSWGDTNVLHFWHLATCGERIVASIRWGNWNGTLQPAHAANWATFFRADIQAYIHAYRAVTGVDITADPVDATLPSVHLLRRLPRTQVVPA